MEVRFYAAAADAVVERAMHVAMHPEIGPLHQVIEEAAGRGLVPRRAPPQPEEALVARHPMHVRRFGIATQLPRPACPAHARHRVLAINARFQTPSSHHLHRVGKTASLPPASDPAD